MSGKIFVKSVAPPKLPFAADNSKTSASASDFGQVGGDSKTARIPTPRILALLP